MELWRGLSTPPLTCQKPTPPLALSTQPLPWRSDPRPPMTTIASFGTATSLIPSEIKFSLWLGLAELPWERLFLLLLLHFCSLHFAVIRGRGSQGIPFLLLLLFFSLPQPFLCVSMALAERAAAAKGLKNGGADKPFGPGAKISLTIWHIQLVLISLRQWGGDARWHIGSVPGLCAGVQGSNPGQGLQLVS